MTKNEIYDALDEFHSHYHIPLLDAVNAVYKASAEKAPESLSEAVKMLGLSAAALEGIILSVERTDSLREDKELVGQVTQLALSLSVCKDELSDLLQNRAA